MKFSKEQLNSLRQSAAQYEYEIFMIRNATKYDLFQSEWHPKNLMRLISNIQQQLKDASENQT